MFEKVFVYYTVWGGARKKWQWSLGADKRQVLWWFQLIHVLLSKKSDWVDFNCCIGFVLLKGLKVENSISNSLSSEDQKKICLDPRFCWPTRLTAAITRPVSAKESIRSIHCNRGPWGRISIGKTRPMRPFVGNRPCLLTRILLYGLLLTYLDVCQTWITVATPEEQTAPQFGS